MGDQSYIDVVTGLPIPGVNYGFDTLTSTSNIQLTASISRVLEVDISTSGKYLAMPNALPLNNGMQWYIKNTGSQDFDIKDWSGATLIVTAQAGISYEIYCKDAETSAGSWGAMTFAGGGGSGGGLTSVGLSGPSIFVYSNNPLVSNGYINITLSSQVSNTFLAGPTTGAATTPAFRTLSNVDLPVMVGDAGAGGVKGAVPAPAAGDAAANKFLSAGGTWATPSGSGAPASASYVVISAEASLIAERILQVGSALSLTDNGAGSSVVIGLDGDLVAVAGLNGQGLATRIAVDTWTTRSIQVSGSALSVTDATGVSGNPTLAAAVNIESFATNTGTGLLVQSGTVIVSRVLTVSGSVASWVNASGSGGNPTLVFDTDLDAIVALSQSGIAVRLSATSWSTRSIDTVTTSRITVSNGNGFSGNPTLDLAVTAVSAGSYSSPNLTIDAYGRVTAASVGVVPALNYSAYTTSGTNTFIKANLPPTVTSIIVVCVGGGGGGGGGNTTGGAEIRGPGGGGGGLAMKRIALSSLSSSETVGVGGFGSGGSTSSTPTSGGAGLRSYFGSFLEASGGAGGAASTAASPIGGNGGSGSGGDINLTGQAGGLGSPQAGSPTIGWLGFGGSAAGGWGAGATQNVQSNGSNYGGGGAGGNHTSGSGGTGAVGMVIVYW